jgi:hypothetical protein
VSLDSNGSLFTVGSGVTLVLDNNVTLLGRDTNNVPLITVSGGSLEMKTGSKISGNATHEGGGVEAAYGSTFTMSGGEISGNTATSLGGGVCVENGAFTKQGGIIYGSDADGGLRNTASNNNKGHAVYVYPSGTKRNTTAGEGVTLDSAKSGAARFMDRRLSVVQL